MNTYEMDYRIPAPNGWHYKKFRQIFNLSKGLGITKEDLTDDGMPVISYGQVHSKSNSGYSLNPSLYRYVSDKYIKSDSKCLVEKGDFIFADTSEDYLGVGNCVFIDNNKSIFAGYHSIIARFADQEEYCGRYFAFLFLTDFWRTQIRAEVMGIKVFSITQKLLRDSFVLVPPKKEQQIIAKFLANRCAKIDSIIADIEKQIELLNEYKKSLITETVTKGLNKKAKMKASGVEWIGDIPMNWSVKRLKYFCKMYSGENLTSEEIESEGDYAVYGGNGIRGYYSNYTNDGEYIIVGRQGALCGNIHIASGKFWATDHAVVTYLSDLMDTHYVGYLFYAMNFNQYSQSAAQPGLAVNRLLDLKTCMPDFDEQKRISSWLDKKIEKIEEIVDVKNKQLEQIKLHKKSLIYEYVTGKKRLRGNSE